MKVTREYGDTIATELLSTADITGVETYTREITQEERATLSSGVTETSIREEDITEEKKAQAAMYNAQLKEVRLEKKRLLRALRTGRTEVAETVHTYLDHDSAKVHKYDERGRLILSRRMTPSEAQLEIK